MVWHVKALRSFLLLRMGRRKEIFYAMSDLLVGIGLVLVFEGLVWGLSPKTGINLLEAASHVPLRTLSLYGWAAVFIGTVIIWMVRG